MTPDVRVVDTDGEREAALSVRREVFVREQGVPEEVEMDGRDDEAVHFLATDDGEPVGTARLREPDPGVGKVERVAVTADYRGEGLGRRIMAELEATAADRGLTTLVLHGQLDVEGFYRELGYETTSDAFEEAGIEHVEMRKELTE